MQTKIFDLAETVRIFARYQIDIREQGITFYYSYIQQLIFGLDETLHEIAFYSLTHANK